MSAGSPLALAGGSLLIVAFVVLLFLGIVWSHYTKSGSDITLTPSDGTR